MIRRTSKIYRNVRKVREREVRSEGMERGRGQYDVNLPGPIRCGRKISRFQKSKNYHPSCYLYFHTSNLVIAIYFNKIKMIQGENCYHRWIHQYNSGVILIQFKNCTFDLIQAMMMVKLLQDDVKRFVKNLIYWNLSSCHNLRLNQSSVNHKFQNLEMLTFFLTSR